MLSFVDKRNNFLFCRRWDLSVVDRIMGPQRWPCPNHQSLLSMLLCMAKETLQM